MARADHKAGGSRGGTRKRAEPVVSLRLPVSLMDELDSYLKTKGREIGEFVMGPNRRRRSGDRRPEGKASICNVRMSNAEQARLKKAAEEAGFPSLQDFLYSRLSPIVQVEARASEAEPAQAAA